MIHRETAEQYHARKAVSAGFLWDIVKPEGCPAYAFARSVFNPEPPPQKRVREFDVGTACHLAVLEPDLLTESIWLLEHDSYRAKAAQDDRDTAIKAGRVPLLASDYELVLKLRRAIEQSPAAELFFSEGGGESEVTYTWEIDGVACKARADRITPHAIVDLKTAASASPSAFQRAMVRDGHHLRAAWYIDGWNEQYRDLNPDTRFSAEANVIWESCPDYLFVVVAKEPPHLVEVNRIEERSLAWGRTLYKKALSEFRRARETEQWSGYSREADKINTVALPAFAENLLIAQERAGAFDANEDIPY